MDGQYALGANEDEIYVTVDEFDRIIKIAKKDLPEEERANQNLLNLTKDLENK